MASGISIDALEVMLADLHVDIDLADHIEACIDTHLPDDRRLPEVVDLHVDIHDGVEMAYVVDALENNDGWYNRDDLVVKVPENR